jgi:uncharacterized protein
MLLARDKGIKLLRDYLELFPVVAIIGPRQSGKTTLVKLFSNQSKADITFFDLEDQFDLAQLNNPQLALQDVKGYVVIDEIQRKPEIFPVLRVLADKKKHDTKFIILGSASRDLINKSSETLAGRIGYIELTPFSLSNVDSIEKLWLRGGFPLSYLAKNQSNSFLWRKEYIRTFLERDIPNLGIRIPARTLSQFWQMLAHYHGQVINLSKLANSLQVSSPTIKNYLNILSGTFMVRQLQPYFINTKKRLVKAPKIFFRDSGIFHALLNIESKEALRTHPFLGASWEGFALEEFIRQEDLKEDECFFWSVHNGPELDLVFERDGKRFGCEIKYSDSPVVTKSMYSAIEELSLEKITIIYPGTRSFKLDKKIEVKPLAEFHKT